MDKVAGSVAGGGGGGGDGEGSGGSVRQALRLCSGKTMSAMCRLFGGGICGPRHCCSFDIELGILRRLGGGASEHQKCVCVCLQARAHSGLTILAFWQAPPTSLRLCFILTVNTWPEQEPLSLSVNFNLALLRQTAPSSDREERLVCHVALPDTFSLADGANSGVWGGERGEGGLGEKTW